jgi:hypothetical protein
MIELPRQEPCEICETLAGRTNVPVVAESEFTITVVTPVQFAQTLHEIAALIRKNVPK